MVPKTGLEPAQLYATAPSRRRVYQFHHFGKCLKLNYTRLSHVLIIYSAEEPMISLLLQAQLHCLHWQHYLIYFQAMALLVF